MTEMTDDWRPFLVRWSQEWADAQGAQAADGRPVPDEGPLRSRWLGFAPAPEERIRAVEERLGHRFPPSYRTFLAVTDGWRDAGGFVWLLAGTGQIRPHEDAAGLSAYFPGELDDDPTPEEALLAGMWQRALQLDVESDAVLVLLDPGDVDDTGEWAVYSWAPWHGDVPRRYASFRAFMEAMYREFHCLEAGREERTGAEFVNATTRALDASVEAARLDALGGRYALASAALAEAVAFGRPRAKGLHDQIAWLLGETYLVDFPALTADPVYASELLPVLATEQKRQQRDTGALMPRLRGAPDPVRAKAEESLRQVREGTFRYSAEGPFGRAVEQAREQARWGGTDAAWRTLRAALPEWRPLGPDHLAPVGLCADPLLGPLITPERGRELLATPRAGEQGDPPAHSADLDPPGLSWLADGDAGDFLASYRLLLVEGVEPARLPGLLGADEAVVLYEPMTLWDARMRFRCDREASTWADEALTAVGRAGHGWSFAFEPAPDGSFSEQRFVSPGIAASRDARTVTVWSEPFGRQRPGVFHLSAAEHGQEQYAFTIRAATAATRGSVPSTLAPARLFPPDAPPETRLGERRALEAIAAEFGVHLPRFALVHGRLHTFRTRSWSRPPEPGEIHATLGWSRRRP